MSRSQSCFSALQRAENSSMMEEIELWCGVRVSVLFSEPKIPQYEKCIAKNPDLGKVSVLFSEPKIPQFVPDRTRRVRVRVSVLFSEPKIPQSIRVFSETTRFRVSVLFSEPKIPQLLVRDVGMGRGVGFSALQRAENSSIGRTPLRYQFRRRFQCSSASRKFLNRTDRRRDPRAPGFQCSSASRKFLNLTAADYEFSTSDEFQCSSASRKFLN